MLVTVRGWWAEVWAVYAPGTRLKPQQSPIFPAQVRPCPCSLRQPQQQAAKEVGVGHGRRIQKTEGCGLEEGESANIMPMSSARNMVTRRMYARQLFERRAPRLGSRVARQISVSTPRWHGERREGSVTVGTRHPGIQRIRDISTEARSRRVRQLVWYAVHSFSAAGRR